MILELLSCVEEVAEEPSGIRAIIGIVFPYVGFTILGMLFAGIAFADLLEINDDEYARTSYEKYRANLGWPKDLTYLLAPVSTMITIAICYGNSLICLTAMPLAAITYLVGTAIMHGRYENKQRKLEEIAAGDI